MNWIQNIARWRRLPAETKLRRRWDAIPADVAQRLAFEGEPVPLEMIRAMLDRIDPSASLLGSTAVSRAWPR